MVHHRHKQRLLTTIVSLIAFVLCIDVFIFLDKVFTLELSLLLSFAVGVLVLSLYHLYNYEHCKEHTTMINNLTQLYFGGLLLVSIFLILLLRWIFSIEIVTSYIILSVVVLGLLFLTLGSYDRFLENHLKVRFPLSAPKPMGHPSQSTSINNKAKKTSRKKSRGK